MARFNIISRQSYKRASWKNGLGYTDEIAIYPEGAELRRGDFLWRLSSARIEQSSPFSLFPDHDRTLVVLNGVGLHLTHSFDGGSEDEEVDVELLAPYEFPGDVPSRCELRSGPITDLSVFARKAEVEAVTEIVEVSGDQTYRWLPAGRWNFAFAAQGRFEVTSQKLAEGDTLRIELEEPLSEENAIKIRCPEGIGRLVIVSLQA